MGKAIALDGASVLSLELDGTEKLVRRRPVELRLLLGETSDIVILENTDREKTLNRLHLERNSAQALDLTLIALDPDFARELRTEAVQAREGQVGIKQIELGAVEKEMRARETRIAVAQTRADQMGAENELLQEKLLARLDKIQSAAAGD